MKKTKFLCGLLAMALVLSLASCSNSSGGSDDNSSSNISGSGSGSDNSSSSNTSSSGSGSDDNSSSNTSGSESGSGADNGGETDSDGDPQIVTFGSFPQSKKTDDTISVDDTDSKSVGSFTYYKGSDGEWYAKIEKNSRVSYYKVEPIKWRVLTENYDHDNNASTPGKKLLLAENILINCRYYDYIHVNRTIGNATIYENNYKYSRIRAYLNGLSYEKKKSDSATQSTDSSLLNKGFLQTAFTSGELAAIADTSVDNTKESLKDAAGKLSTSEKYVCPNTTDKIFLLSEKEVTTSAYGFAAYDAYIGDSNGTTTSTRIRMSTDFAKDSGANLHSWWLRSPLYDYSNYARNVEDNGNAGYSASVDSDRRGVVPALCLN